MRKTPEDDSSARKLRLSAAVVENIELVIEKQNKVSTVMNSCVQFDEFIKVSN